MDESSADLDRPRPWLDGKFAITSSAYFSFQSTQTGRYHVTVAEKVAKRRSQTRRLRQRSQWSSIHARHTLTPLFKFTSRLALAPPDPIGDLLSQMLERFHIGNAGFPLAPSETAKLDSSSGNVIFNVERLRLQWEPEFHNFGRLPFELRLKIWQFSLPRKRVLTLKKKICSRIISKNYITSTKTWYSPVPIPVILQVSFEARQEALRFYKLTLGNWYCKTLYLDTAFDIILFAGESFNSISLLFFLVQHNSLDGITSVALDRPLCNSLQSTLVENYTFLEEMTEMAKQRFKGLQSAIHICAQDPAAATHEMEISACPIKSCALFAENEKQALENFLGVKLSSGHIVEPKKNTRAWHNKFSLNGTRRME